jgi:MoxR-like ATPase
MMKVIVDYPPSEAELAVVRTYAKGVDLHNVDSLISAPLTATKDILALRRELPNIVISDDVLAYIQRLTSETRDPVYAQLGASTRAAVNLLKAARALASLKGLAFVTPDDVKDVALPVLRHRVILRPEALIDGLTPDYFLDNILRRIPVPR